MPSLRYRELATSRGEDGAVVSARIDKILAFRAEHPDTDERLSFDADSHRLMESVMDRLSFSARAVELVRRVARVIADMEGSMRIRVNHLSEAIQYRILERVL
jgi:magnesium chelatase family protein